MRRFVVPLFAALVFALPGCTARWVLDTPHAGHRAHTVEEARFEAEVYTRLWKQVARNVQRRSDLVWKWSAVAECESGGNWSANTGNGYYGGVQFLLSTWRSVGGSGYPHENSPGEQAYRAEILRERAGLGQWPVCGRFYR